MDTLARQARAEAAAAQLDTSALVGTVSGSANTQQSPLPARFVQQGRTTANGASVILPVPIPLHHSARLRVTISGRLVTVGAAGTVDDSFMEEDAIGVFNHTGTPSESAHVSGTAFVDADVSQQGNTIAFIGVPGNIMEISATQAGASNVGATVDWTIVAEVLYN
jgi:hypothetical protein